MLRKISILSALAIAALIWTGASNLFPPGGGTGGGTGPGGAAQIWTNDTTGVYRPTNYIIVPLALAQNYAGTWMAQITTNGDLQAQSIALTNLSANSLPIVSTAQQLTSLAPGGANTVLIGTTPLTFGAVPSGALPADGGGFTNLTIRYDTNAIPSSGALTFGHSYWTNLQADITYPAFTLNAAYYETLLLEVTNSTAADHKLTMPAGVRVAIANGGGSVIWCSNKTVTEVVIAHYGALQTNAWKNDF